MTPEQVAALGPSFAAYLREFEDCFGQDRTREHLHTYCRGLLSDLPRKSVEPIALAAVNPARPLPWISIQPVSGLPAARDRDYPWSGLGPAPLSRPSPALRESD